MTKRRTPETTPKPQERRAFRLPRVEKALYPERASNLIELVLEKAFQDQDPSAQGVSTGTKPHPFGMQAAMSMRLQNVYHARCIDSKKNSIAGLGFKSKATTKRLNPLCEIAWQGTFGPVMEDFVQVGNGYLEVVRDSAGKISGLHHVQAHGVLIEVENVAYDRHYVVRVEGREKKYARFGDLEEFRRRFKTPDNVRVGEIIHFREPSSMDRWYGIPNWLAAVGSIELKSALDQHNYDFFNNRGVPEFMLFLLGQKIPREDWDKVTSVMESQTGKGNSHKSIALNITGEEMKVQLEKLALEVSGDQMFKDFSETLALEVVSAHGVPPLLAGIQIPGKLGANNELPNAIMAFQALVIGPFQQTVQSTLDCSLGKEWSMGDDAFDFRTITEEIDVGTMATTSRMRQTIPEARAQGRDLDEGLLRDGRKSAELIEAAFGRLDKADQLKLVECLAKEVMERGNQAG